MAALTAFATAALLHEQEEQFRPAYVGLVGEGAAQEGWATGTGAMRAGLKRKPAPISEPLSLSLPSPPLPPPPSAFVLREALPSRPACAPSAAFSPSWVKASPRSSRVSWVTLASAERDSVRVCVTP